MLQGDVECICRMCTRAALQDGTPATGADRGMPALANARVALLTAVMAAAPSSASTSLVSRMANGNTRPLGMTPAARVYPSDAPFYFTIMWGRPDLTCRV